MVIHRLLLLLNTGLIIHLIFTLFLLYRHTKVSLDMLLKLVAVFGPTIRATVSAPPSVGVDLHQEERWPPFSHIILFPFSCILHVNEPNFYKILRTDGNAATSALWNCKKSKWSFQYWYGNHAVFNGVDKYVNWKQFLFIWCWSLFLSC